MEFEIPKITQDNTIANQVVFTLVNASRKVYCIALWIYKVSIPNIVLLYVVLKFSALQATVARVI